MLDHFKKLYKYDNWANIRMFEALDSWEHPAPKAIGLMAHLITAKLIWLNRIEQQDNSQLIIWPELTLSESRSLCEKQNAGWQACLKKLDEEMLTKPLTYRNSKGKLFHDPLKDILQHVVIHGQHHRAQIAMLMRMDEIAPPVTDYIYFIRYGS